MRANKGALPAKSASLYQTLGGLSQLTAMSLLLHFLRLQSTQQQTLSLQVIFRLKKVRWLPDTELNDRSINPYVANTDRQQLCTVSQSFHLSDMLRIEPETFCMQSI